MIYLCAKCQAKRKVPLTWTMRSALSEFTYTRCNDCKEIVMCGKVPMPEEMPKVKKSWKGYRRWK